LTGFASDIPSLFGIYKPASELILLGKNSSQILDGTDPSVLWLGKSVWIAQFWSVGSEMWFYLLAPFIIGCSWIALASMWAGFYSLGHIWTATSGNGTYFFTPYLAIFFVAGVLSYRVYKKFSVPRLLTGLPYYAKALLIGSPLIWAAAIPAAGKSINSFLLYSIAFITIPILFSLTSSNHLDRQIGDLSYPLYVSHLLSFSIVFLII
jgi:peptidoglycan/LPS O-acetylase OafA/YrhL